MGVFVAVLVVTFIQLGEWQLRRLDERRASNATVQTHEALPVQPYQDVMTGEIGDADQWYRVSATGAYTGSQFQVRYRSLDGAYGSEVVAVLKTDRGDNLLVNRGFLTREPGHPDGVMPDTTPGRSPSPGTCAATTVAMRTRWCRTRTRSGCSTRMPSPPPSESLWSTAT
nr:SURF1 family cytochrome oxidase biogenesis protein [Tessaracoccus coleopterorum]